jgi:hypothetical protein
VGDAARPAGKARALPGLTLGVWLGLTGGPAALLAGAAGASDHTCPAPESWRRDTIDTSFERERRLAGLAIPLRSHGRVRSDGETIWWHTRSPIDMVMRIDRDAVSQSIDGGPMEPLAGASTGGAEIAALTATLLNGDLGRARADFTIERRQDATTGRWHVSLVPDAPPLARLIRRIELTGCDRVEAALVVQPNGDQDRVIFGEEE